MRVAGLEDRAIASRAPVDRVSARVSTVQPRRSAQPGARHGGPHLANAAPDRLVAEAAAWLSPGLRLPHDERLEEQYQANQQRPLHVHGERSSVGSGSTRFARAVP